MATNESPAPQSSPLAHALIRGRIRSFRRSMSAGQRVIRTVIVMPAPSEYENPSVVEIVSTEKLGEVGDGFAGRVRISGYGKSWKADDGDGGTVTVQGAEVVLHHVP